MQEEALPYLLMSLVKQSLVGTTQFVQQTNGLDTMMSCLKGQHYFFLQNKRVVVEPAE